MLYKIQGCEKRSSVSKNYISYAVGYVKYCLQTSATFEYSYTFALNIYTSLPFFYKHFHIDFAEIA
jgi:hypothetical protein